MSSTEATGAEGEGQDGVVGGPRNPQQIAAQKRLQQSQAQVDEVVDIMRSNVEKVLERDQKLSELDNRADALQQGASQFEQQAGKLKRKFWLKNLKMMIIMGVIVVIIIIIIGAPGVLSLPSPGKRGLMFPAVLSLPPIATRDPPHPAIPSLPPPATIGPPHPAAS